MAADCGKVTFTRRQMARSAYNAARGYGLPRWAALYVALRSAQPVTVHAYVDSTNTIRTQPDG